jgi:tetratricopeptide (TPR) repeat protein
MKTLLTTALLFTTLSLAAQTTPGKLSFALPEHPGHLTLDKGDFEITELSAKANGNEFGIRAKDADLNFLGFLFLWPEKPNLTSESCRDAMLSKEGASLTVRGKSSFTSKSGANIAIALLIPENGKSSSIRAFSASGELCADLLFSLHKPITEASIDPNKVKATLETLNFDPTAKSSFRDAFAYATVAWDHHQLEGAANAYTAALKLVDTSEDPPKWRRVTTDQLSMALGMSGDLKGSRAVNEAAITKDPTYPLYYYNLACADAEQGDASAARKHLQQAFDRKANTLPGETFPDPSTDDSIQKLKSNTEFWTFVQTLHP